MRRIDPLGWRRVAAKLATGIAALACLAALLSEPLGAQPANNPGPGNFPNANAMPGVGPGGNLLLGAPGSAAAPGGGANADFDSLIDLIESTVAVDSWAETGGGQGDIRPFYGGGVLVDAAGTLMLRERAAADSSLSRLRGAPPPSVAVGDPHQASELRYVSLPRLEREIARRQAAHEPLDAAMLTLAGLQRVRYVFIYPESGDLVLAGPAGDWRVDPFGRIVSTATGGPVVRLDDLLALVRRAGGSADSQFGCSITPRQDALARTQAFLDQSSGRAISPRERRAWLGRLRDTLGKQDIEIFGVDPTSRVARVLVEADYHMKLIGMGLAEGVDGVPSYLASIPAGGAPPMSVLRWWFTLNYQAIRTSAAGDAYELVGQGAGVLSENELLAEQGQRVHTGQSDPLNRQFAERFTTHFAALAEKYPIYAELRNLFDLALVTALVEHDHLAERVGWQPMLLADAERLRLPHGPVPRQVETVVNHRVIDRRQIIAGVSGGVLVAPADVMDRPRNVDQDGVLSQQRRDAPAGLEAAAWWWDAAE